MNQQLQELILSLREDLSWHREQFLPYYNEADIYIERLDDYFRDIRRELERLAEAHYRATGPSKRERDADTLGEELFEQRRDESPRELP